MSVAEKVDEAIRRARRRFGRRDDGHCCEFHANRATPRVGRRRGWSLVVSYGDSGGFYGHVGGLTSRLALGRISLSWIRADIDDVLPGGELA